MDKTDIEKLMDKYKAEMLEFSKKNNLSGYPSALSENEMPVERDRRDPLLDENITSDEEEAIPAQTSNTQEIPVVEQSGETDVAEVLRKECADVSPNSTREQRMKCKAINDFLASNRESGTLRVETFASDRAFGVGSARVMIFLPLASGNITLYDGLTDIDGISETLKLPAPAKSISQSPQTGKNPLLPYALYSVYVEHPQYVRSVFTNVPVFSGVESVQPVRMIAKAQGLQEPEPVVVDENGAFEPERQR